MKNEGQGQAVYHTNRAFVAVNTSVAGEPTVFKLLNVSTQLTEIVGPGNVITNMDESQAIEKEAVSWGYTNAAIDAWTDVHDAYPGNIREHPLGTIYDNVGFLAGTRRAYGKWGAYLWLLQNKIVFQTSSNNMWFSSNSVPNVIQQVVVGTIGDFAPTQKVVDVGPLESDGVGAYPGGAWGMWNGGSTDVVYTADFTAYYLATGIQARVEADVNEDGQIDEADDLIKCDMGQPGLVVGVSDNIHTFADGREELDWVDEEINGITNKLEDLKPIRIRLTPRRTTGAVLIRCTNKNHLRIFDETDEPVIGPNQDFEYAIPASSIPEEGLEYRVEAIETAREVDITASYLDGNGGESGFDRIRVTTIGMTMTNSYALGSLEKVMASQIYVGEYPTRRWWAISGQLGYNNPAYILVRMKPGAGHEYEVTQAMFEGLKRGDYEITDFLNPEHLAMSLEEALLTDSEFEEFVGRWQEEWDYMYNELIDGGWTEDEFIDDLGPRPTIQTAYEELLFWMHVPLGDAKYYWQLPAQYTTGQFSFYVKRRNAVRAKQNHEMIAQLFQIDLDVDADRNDLINDDDDVWENWFSGSRGAGILVNNDSDVGGGQRDFDDENVNGPNDLLDMARLRVKPLGLDRMPLHYRLVLRVWNAKASCVRVFGDYTTSSSSIISTNPSVGEISGDWKTAVIVQPGADTSAMTEHDYAVEALKYIGDKLPDNTSFNGEINIELAFQHETGSGWEDIKKDNILLTVFVPELDVGETARLANRIAWNDPRTVDDAKNKIVIWSTDYTADKTRFDLLKYSDIGWVCYKIEENYDWWLPLNSGYPIEDVLTFNKKTFNPVHAELGTPFDFRIYYGPTAAKREESGPYEVYAVSWDEYTAARNTVDFALYPLADWAEAVYSVFLNGGAWPGSWPAKWVPTSVNGAATFLADQWDVAYADLTHKFGATLVENAPVVIDGRRYPSSTATVPVFYWNSLTPVNDLFRQDVRVENVVSAFLGKIEYAELYSRYMTSPPSASGVGRDVQWEFSMADHHKLYWTYDTTQSLTGGNDTLLIDILGAVQGGFFDVEPLGCLGDVWVVGSDLPNQLYGGNGYITLTVLESPSGDLVILDNPTINMTVEDVFDFDYWGGDYPRAAASIQCAFGRPNIGTGIGQVVMLRFDVVGPVAVGDITVSKP